MKVNGYELTSFTHFSEEVCLKLLNIIEKEFGEIGDLTIENDEIYFTTYRAVYENPPEEIKDEGLNLTRVGMFDDLFFCVAYQVSFIENTYQKTRIFFQG